MQERVLLLPPWRGRWGWGGRSRGGKRLADVGPEKLHDPSLDLWTLGNLWLTGDVQTLPAQFEAQGYAADLVLTQLPCLEQLAMQLAPRRATQPWERGYCRTCGAWPVLTEQRGLEQLRYPRRSLCASSWEVDCLLCPFCTTRDLHVLGYLQVEGEESRNVSRPAMPARAT
jgi:hypothetical protein